MTTEAQLAANRANAQRSTGPNTIAGKAKSSTNARKRRVPGEMPLTLDEDLAAFTAHCDAVGAALLPQDAFEAELVRQIAVHQWRLGRLQRIEAALFDAETHRVDYSRRAHYNPADPNYRGLSPADIWPERLDPLSRREAQLERALAGAVALLERRQAARRRGEIPANEASYPREINDPA